ncbi:MAG: hypothetical protein J0H17_01415 [Rhizobiales bacterium]|nr:hypothetical protein [Hyphomicrobiales bacterium]
MRAPPRKRLSSSAREALYDACRGGKEFPDCNICGQPIGKGQRWHESHDPLLPHALGGAVTGIAHARCNLDHAYEVDIPLVAKVKRQRQKDIGAFRTSRPLPGGRDDRLKKKINGRVEERWA